ncbi:GtrA family protein [Aquimonas voraii]|uniref:Putative flippase GtrA (Transmembrane translocase of bactoprenol-linked glucose) n=1 Tax=Aquimonas voraii TaxID=265719 RepID=A0A1G6U3D7_9GAMM|nr:GtrA family protein [Aquimonas voraii]SDD35196.1 Putative flippase GtrA (transmembrane translocase of bactoprenol-linked glucose) [Aquimonas voraii]
MAEARPGAAALPAQALRFLLAGGANTAITYALFWVLSAWMHHQLALAVAFATGIGLAYLLNSRFVFATTGSARSALGYPLVYLATYALNATLVETAVRLLGWPPRLALLGAIAIVVPVSFGLNRWWLLRGVSPAWPSEDRAAAVLLGLALLATALLYAPGYGGYWLGDDFSNLHRAYVWALKSETLPQLLGLFTRSVSEGAAFFRPAILASLSFDYLHSGTCYGGWFLYNHGLHLANMTLVAAVVMRLSARAGLAQARLPAALAATLFGLSPVLAEGVWWVSARSDLSVTFLALLALWLWIGRPEARLGAAALPLLMLPALLFKESAALLPLQFALLWLAMPELRERRRGIALLFAFGLMLAFLAWRAHLFGDAWQVYGGDAPRPPASERLASVATSLWPWALGWSSGQVSVLLAHLVLLALAAAGALLAAQRRLAVLALAAAGGGALLATFLNLGGLIASGEGGRLFYGPLAFLALALGLACARDPAAAQTPTLRAAALSFTALAALAGALLLWPLLQTAWRTQDALRGTAAALPALAAREGPMLLLMPDHVGPVVALRNGQSTLVLRPLQAEGLLHQILPTLPQELALRHGQYAQGLLDRLDSARLQHWDADAMAASVADTSPRWPQRIGCWSQSQDSVVEFPAPPPEDADAWTARILAEARAHDCLLD